MIIGIGVDRLAIRRIEVILAKPRGNAFQLRLYTDAERQQAQQKNNKARRLAMLFAAKEAVAKAMGTGFRGGVSFIDIEVLHQAIGKPEVFLHAKTALIAKAKGIHRMHLSLSDDDGVAMAFAVAESK